METTGCRSLPGQKLQTPPSQAPPCGSHTQTCSVCQSVQASSTSVVAQTWVCADCRTPSRPAAQTKTTRKLRPRLPARTLVPTIQPARPALDSVLAGTTRPGVFDPDVASGSEPHPVAAVNLVDGSIVGFSEPSNIVLTDTIDERSRAAHTRTLEYITKPVREAGIPMPPPAVLPAKYKRNPHGYIKYLNGNELPYALKPGKGFKGSVWSTLMRPVLYECGPHLGCPKGINCPHAATQRGCPYRLELRQTPNKGWALYTLDFIAAGTFVIEYTGVIRHQTMLNDGSTRSSGGGSRSMSADHEEDAAGDHDNEYAFDMEPRPGCDDVNLPLLPQMLDRPAPFVLDAWHKGNASRFINHDCSPNLFVQPVLDVHHDHTQPKICFFAEQNILPETELTFHYGDEYVKSAQWRCCCGAKDCVAYRRSATPVELSPPLHDFCCEDEVVPVVPTQPVVSAWAKKRASPHTVQSTRTYSSNRAIRLFKRRKTNAQAARAQLARGLHLGLQGLQEFPELRQAALGQWPPMASEKAAAADISEISGTVQPDRAEDKHSYRSFQELLADPDFGHRSPGPRPHLSSSDGHVTTCKQEAGEEEARQKHTDIKRLLSLNPRTLRLKSSYIGWMRRDSSHKQWQEKVIQLHKTLKQLQTDSLNEAEVVERWERHFMLLF